LVRSKPRSLPAGTSSEERRGDQYNINLRRLMAAANAAPENVGDSGN
jgi:hypothetical protein